MAFFRFSRDKRGYEHFYLMQPGNRGKARPRLLYWFRTPPNVKVGRGPFEPEIQRALEAQNPDIVFDWKAIVQAPIPPADTERWRERRRVERAMRTAAELEVTAAEGVEEPQEELEPEPPAASAVRTPPANVLAPVRGTGLGTGAETRPPDIMETPQSTGTETPHSTETRPPSAEPPPGGRRRRRRRRRRGRGNQDSPGSQGSQAGEAQEVQDSGESENSGSGTGSREP